MRCLWRLAALAAWSLTGPPSMAQDAPLTLARAEQLVLQSHPRALAATEELARARSTAMATWSGMLPRADVSSSWTRYEAAPAGALFQEGDEIQRHSVSITQPLFAGGRLAAGAGAGMAGLRAARERHRAALAQLVYDVRAAWVDWLAAREQVSIARGGVDFASRQLKRALQQEEQGVAGRIDRLFIENALALAEIQGEESWTAERAARLKLESLLQRQLAAEEPLEELTSLLSRIPDSLAATYVVESLPDVSGLRWDLRQASWQRWSTAGSLLPAMSAGLAWSNDGSDPFTYDHRHTTRTVGLNLSWNLFRGGANSLATLSAMASMRRARHLLEAGTLTARADLDLLERQISAGRRKVELTARSLEISMENLGLLEQKHGLGMVPATDLLQGEQNHRGARGSQVQAQASLLKAVWLGERLAGRW